MALRGMQEDKLRSANGMDIGKGGRETGEGDDVDEKCDCVVSIVKGRTLRFM